MRNILALTIAAALPLALGACETTGEPQGGPVFALVNAGRPVGRLGADVGDAGRGHLPHRRVGPAARQSTASTSTRIGRCDPPGFDQRRARTGTRAARKHGFNNPAGPHRGDMPNVTVAANGVLQRSGQPARRELRRPARRGRRRAGDPRRAPTIMRPTRAATAATAIACAVITAVVPAAR